MLRKKNIRVKTNPYTSERIRTEIYSHNWNRILREGQFVYNTAYMLYPNAVGNIMHKVDCYYLDDKIDAFINELCKWLNEHTA